MLARGLIWLLLFGLLGTMLSCQWLRKPQTRKIPPPAEVPARPPAHEPAPASVENQPVKLPSPPVIEPETVPTLPPPESGEVSALPPPPRKKRTKRSPSAPKPAKKPAAAPASAPTVAEPVAAPRLTQLLSKQEQWEYNHEIDDLLLAVSRILGKLEKRPLAEDEMDLLGRVHAFARQTTETRKVDLVTARSLARRAELLARELEESTR